MKQAMTVTRFLGDLFTYALIIVGLAVVMYYAGYTNAKGETHSIQTITREGE